MKTRLIIAAAVVLGAALTACGGGGKKSLTANQWKLTELAHADSTAAVTVPGNVTIEFSDSTMVFGNAGCNRFFAKYELTGSDQISIGQAGSTMMWCPNMPFENTYLKLLGQVKSYEVGDGRLVLKDSEGKFTLRYEPIENNVTE